MKKKKKISEKLDFVSFFEMNSDSSEMWIQSKTIEYITSKLYSIDLPIKIISSNIY